ncbi:PatB family C-S lyase [Proteiniphilum sp.]|uniref:MalY/PatB family protein n=1 Tax=Proteiniphilum sp. TaxID=1926877 RepID=UPI002B1FD078|nr:PatB family C-S lyase [Proteiniphilum sp.]MEA4916047.1 PatB family C-S lyase [Proteiniphilum sp.]
MQYNFDEIVDRSGSNAVKLERLKPVFGQEDLIPLWVADMDFKSPPAIVEALKQRVEHGVFGYTLPSEEYTSSIVNWLARRHHWQVKGDHINFVPGVVKGFAFAIDEFTAKGDKIIIQPPVYHPFRIVTESLGREVVNNPLILEEGQYKMDFEGLRRIVSDNDCKMLILCNPHNPGGRTWSPAELNELADICYGNNILVVSDEIHADMALSGHQHTPFASVSAKAEEISLTLMAPSKTFNIAGIVSSFAVILNKKIRERYLAYLEPRELQQGTIFAFTATRAAYDECEEWLDQMLAYVQANIDFVDNYLKENIPEIKTILPEASFLVWLDCRTLDLPQRELVKLFIEKAHLALNDGAMFGLGGEGFMRLNAGCPRSTLEKGLINLKKAIHP